MELFKSYLKNNKVVEHIDASTLDCVYFENNNKKKFIYPLENLDACLLAFYISGDRLKSFFSASWQYAEEPFREAMRDIEDQLNRWNAAAQEAREVYPDEANSAQTWADALDSLRPSLFKWLTEWPIRAAVPDFDPADHGGAPQGREGQGPGQAPRHARER